MAERHIHEWINSFIALAALAVSAYFAYQSNQLARQANRLKAENISVSVRSNRSCPAVVDTNRSTIILCWTVLLSNRSENETSITDYFIYRNGPLENGLRSSDEFDINLLPIDINSGSTKKFSMYTLHYMDTNTSEAIRKVGVRGTPRSIGEIESKLRDFGVDLFGNHVQNDGLNVQYNPTYHLMIVTGKDQRFVDDFRWSDHEGFFPHPLELNPS